MTPECDILINQAVLPFVFLAGIVGLQCGFIIGKFVYKK